MDDVGLEQLARVGNVIAQATGNWYRKPGALSERLHLRADNYAGEQVPVWEVTYTLHDEGLFESYTVLVDARTGGVLEDEPQNE